MIKKNCDCCYKEYTTIKKKQKYCSHSCSNCKKMRPRIMKICKYTGCSKTFEVIDTSPKMYCSRSCVNKSQTYRLLGQNNGNYGRKNSWGHHDEKRRELIRQKVTESWKCPERLAKHRIARENYKREYGYYPGHSIESREKISESNVRRYLETNGNHSTKYGNSKHGHYFNKKNNLNEFYHSSWEEKRMIELDNDNTVIGWTKQHGINIKYKYKGINRTYIPDFLIEYDNGVKIIEEVKGYIDNIPQFKLKLKYSKKFCKNNNFEYVVNFMDNYERYKKLLK